MYLRDFTSYSLVYVFYYSFVTHSQTVDNSGCAELTHISFPDSIITYGANFLSGCTKIESLVFPSGNIFAEGGAR